MLIYSSGKSIDLRPTKIIAVARNYLEHAREMKAALPDEPTFFLKPPSALIPDEGVVVLPARSSRVDYEVELAAVIKERLRKIPARDIEKYLMGYSVMVDVTARDIQAKAKKEGMPWAIAKGFDTFAPLGPKIVPAGDIDVSKLAIWLKVNGEYKQRGNTDQMIFPVDELISYISHIMTLEPMDIIATGTPSGIGPMSHGDEIEAGIENIGVLRFSSLREQ